MIQEVVKVDWLGNDLVNLPKNWLWMKLGDIARTSSGGTPSRRNPEYFIGSIPWVKSGELDDGWIYDTEEKISQEAIEKSSAKRFSQGTLLMAMYGATVGKLAILGIEAATNQAICSIFPKDFLDRDFLFYYLKSIRPTLLGQSFGGAQPNISQTVIKAIPVPVPTDINIQRRIVARIEALLAEVRSSREVLDEMRRDCDRLLSLSIEEVAKSITSERKPLIDVLQSKPRNGWSPKGGGDSSGTPVLKLGAVLRFRYNKDEYKLTDQPTNPDAHYWLDPGDILISRSNTPELVGHAAIYSGAPYPCIYPDLIMRMKVNESQADSRFLIYWLQTNEVREYVQAHASGASSTMKKITQPDVCNIPFPKINALEQLQISTYLSSIESEANRMLELMDQDAKTLDLLEQSILERAFRGEL